MALRLLEKLRDPLREAVGLPLGEEGAYYMAGEISFDPNFTDPTIINYNEPPPRSIALICALSSAILS